MRRTCARALRIGLPVVIFTEHLDFSGWRAAPEDFPEHERQLIDLSALDRVNGSLHTLPFAGLQ